jgi:hypothetical protein
MYQRDSIAILFADSLKCICTEENVSVILISFSINNFELFEYHISCMKNVCAGY